MDRKIDECYDSTYGVLMDRKIAERCASTIWCIDGKKKIVDYCDSTYSVLMDRKIAECCKSIMQSIDG
jgi:hypothetical protein